MQRWRWRHWTNCEHEIGESRDEAVRRGLAELRWPARVEVVSRDPTVILDAAHNTASIASLLETLQESFAGVWQRSLAVAEFVRIQPEADNSEFSRIPLRDLRRQSTLPDPFTAHRPILIFATSQDKDIRGMLKLLLPQFESVIFTRVCEQPALG